MICSINISSFHMLYVCSVGEGQSSFCCLDPPPRNNLIEFSSFDLFTFYGYCADCINCPLVCFCSYFTLTFYCPVGLLVRMLSSFLKYTLNIVS